jgi:hypothetical protein
MLTVKGGSFKGVVTDSTGGNQSTTIHSFHPLPTPPHPSMDQSIEGRKEKEKES